MLIVITAVLGVLVGGGWAIRQTPMYTATTKAYLAVHFGATPNDLIQGATFAQQVVQSYADIATTSYVLDAVVDEVGLHESASGLAKQVSVAVVPNELVMEISATSTSPTRAAAIANAVASNLGSAATRLAQGGSGTTVPVTVTRLATAAAPTEPSSPILLLALAVGLLAGLVLGILLALLREALDTRIRGMQDLYRAIDMPVLGQLWRGRQEEGLATTSDPQGTSAEAYRSLRANLQFYSIGRDLKSVLITSAVPGEGKTTTVANLGVALAQAGQRVAIVDADLRCPTLADRFGLDGAVGLTDVLIGGATVRQAVQATGVGGVSVLPSGPVPPNPSELLQSEAMRQTVVDLQRQYDVVLFDTAPLLSVSDAIVLGRHVGGVLVVAGAGRVRRPQLHDALWRLRSVELRVLGVVANRLPQRGVNAAHYRPYAYPSEASSLDPVVAAAAVAVEPAKVARPRRVRKPAAAGEPSFEVSGTTP